VEVGPDTFSGLLLPAPAEIALSVTVPPSGELWWRPVLVPPEVRDLAGSDGVTVEIAVEEGASSTVVATVVVPSEGAGDLLHHDLSRWTGKTVQVVFRTYPGATNVQDYLLVAEPAVAPRKAAPKRVILAFVDTLRADHTSLYGHSRDTTPWLASQAQHARVYTQARSVAPWTLPAWRSAISGRLPRFWAEGPNLAESLRDHGWATAFFAGNLYLSPRFAGNRGFGQHHLRHAPPATEQAQRAAAWLKSVPDRDVFLVVHFMDPHLPYREPEEYRHRYAGSTPRGWRDKFSRGDVLSRRTSEAERAWVRDRYDNNIRFVDDALATLDQHLRPDDLVVVFSDHGEEFWDHGGFEHGHATWDEVIRVPLVIRGPGFSAGFTPTPVSLLDLAPTVLAWAKLPPNPTHGRSLLGPLATDDRVLPFGHALYGYERWGFVQGGNKYSSTQGWEGLYQIQDDPLEQRDLWRARIPDDVGVWRAKLARAHEAMVREGWRFGLATTAQGTSGGTLEVLVPGGIAFAWAGEDAMGAGPIEVTVEGDRAQFRWASHWAGQRDLYIIPTRPIETAEALVQAANTGTPPSPMNRISVQRRRPDGDPRPLGESTLADGTRVTWTFAVAPEPKPGATEIIGYDPELELQLRAAGYIVGPTP
jgi:arylsulfatase A-like enzyme